jgi:glycosyltransferase involved in cell wall biosynthesis
VDHATIRAWHQTTDAVSRRVELSYDDEAGEPGRDCLPAGISVVVPSHRGRDHIGRCLVSLADQMLDPGLFEVIVVLNGPPDGTREVVDEFRREHEFLTLRVIQLTLSGASRARNAGIAAASRQYTTFVDDDDYVSPTFLEVLLANAAPGIVPIVALVDVRPDGLDPDNHVNRMIAARAGTLTHPADLRVATTANAGKAIATNLIKDIPYAVDLASGEDVLFWTTVVAKRHVLFYPCPPSDAAIYYRVLRENSVSRQAMTFDFAVRQRVEVISRLESLFKETDGRTVELLRSRIRAQTGFIDTYLRENPGDHGRVVQLLDRQPIFQLPYDRMNGSRARGLAIAYAFPPYADTSAVVTAKRVRARGEIVDVVSNAMGRIREVDETIGRISGPFVGHRAALNTPTYFSDWGSMEAFSIEGLKTIQAWEKAKGRYEWVYSRAQFAASHFLAAAYKLSNPAATWHAEFSDPLARDIYDEERGTPVKKSVFVEGLRAGMRDLGLPLPKSDNCFIWCEEIAYALADELIFTNQNQLDYMLSYCSNGELAAIARSKAVISPQPTLPREFYSMFDTEYPLEGGVAHLAYFGNFYATRGLDEVLVAIADTDAAIRARVRVHVFTSKPAALEARATELDISENVLVSTYVRYLEFLSLTMKFDALIVNDAITARGHRLNPYLPSKWADYRGSGTPVWGLVEAGSPLSSQQLAFASPVGDVAAAKDILAQLVARKLGSGGGPGAAPAEAGSRVNAAR